MSSPLRTPQKLMTAEEYAELPDDGRRYELVRGVLVEMSHPQSHHGLVVTQLAYLFKSWARTHPGWLVVADVGHVIERGPDTVRGPDVAFVRRDRLDLRKTSWVEGGPDLAVEVRSPGDRRGEIDEARRRLPPRRHAAGMGRRSREAHRRRACTERRGPGVRRRRGARRRRRAAWLHRAGCRTVR